MEATNQVFLMTFLVISLGYILKRLNIISEKDGKVISKFMMHSTFPALMLASTMNTKLDYTLFLIPIFSLIVGILTFFAAWFVFRKYTNQLRGIFMMGFGATNVGLFGYPIVQSLFGSEALAYMVMYDIGNTICGFGIAYPLGKYFSTAQGKVNWSLILKKVATLPPLIALLTGLLISSVNFTLPTIVQNFLKLLANGNTPIGLLLLGIYLSFNLEKKQIVGISKVLTLRYLSVFLVLGFLYIFLPENNLRNVLMLAFLLPLGIMILPFSDEMNYDSKIAGTMVNISLIISFILMWCLMISVKT